MKTWVRRAGLDGPRKSWQIEEWALLDGSTVLDSFPVEVTYGKPFDVLRLKTPDLKELRAYANYLRRTAEKLYVPGKPRPILTECPCCQASEGPFQEGARIFGQVYHLCGQCGHAFIKELPDPQDLHDLFSQAEEHSAPYIDQATIDLRLEQIIQPKLAWVLDVYQRHRPGQVSAGLDVGAGGGHFLAGLQRAGLEGIGYELSEASRNFARAAFGLNLRASDFLTDVPEPGRVQLVTFWGLLEYTQHPRRFLAAARRWLGPADGLLIVEVPRYNCLGSIVQGWRPHNVTRHLDPTSHVNCFSDASLAWALKLSGFKPVAAWYFGMDVYELLVQLALTLEDSALIARLADLITPLQAGLDAVRFSDDLVMAAVPITDGEPDA